MMVPLSRHLTRFSSGAPTSAIAVVPTIFEDAASPEPSITLSVHDLEARLDSARFNAKAEAAATFETKLERLETEHQTTLNDALKGARQDWVVQEANRLDGCLDGAFAALASTLHDRLANVLQPILKAALVDRTVGSFAEALDQLLADPARALITVRGPRDLLDALQAKRGAPARVAFEATETVEISMTAADAYVESRLGAALASVSAEMP